ncbi:ESD, partial [Cervus elaphus hippelaphus]
MALKQVSSSKCFGGLQKVFEHDSVELKCKMKFAVYLPPKAETGKCPVLYWLSGLTCTEQNFISKSGYHQAASEHGLVVVAPDTSPRGCNIKGEEDSWDFGTGAGFYAYDATCLVKSYPGSQLDILIDQGKEDEFLSDGQLLPDNFIAACTEKKI